MALNLADRIAVRANIVPRCTAAVTNFALYILAENAGAANHANRLAWAREAMRDPGRQGEFLSWYVLDNAEYLSGGSDITDATLKSVVETAITNNFIQPAA